MTTLNSVSTMMLSMNSSIFIVMKPVMIKVSKINISGYFTSKVTNLLALKAERMEK